MTSLHFETTVPLDGRITLPPEFQGQPVEVHVRKTGNDTPKRAKHSINEFIEKFSGVLKGYTEEDIEELRLQSLKEKYGL